jgi:hypothetical protein
LSSDVLVFPWGSSAVAETLRSYSDDKAVVIVDAMANVVWIESVTLIASKPSNYIAGLRYSPWSRRAD